MTERGRGNLKGAFGNRRKPADGAAEVGRVAPGGSGGGVVERSARLRGRRSDAGTGKRGRPDQYTQLNGMVRRSVVERFERARVDPEVRRELELRLFETGVEFKRHEPDNGAVLELLLARWLESVGY